VQEDRGAGISLVQRSSTQTLAVTPAQAGVHLQTVKPERRASCRHLKMGPGLRRGDRRWVGGGQIQFREMANTIHILDAAPSP